MAAQPTADAQAKAALEQVSAAMTQPGKVFRSQLNIRERAQGANEVSSTATVWIDPEQRKARFELRRDNTLIGVTGVDNWDVAVYDAITNKLANINVPDEARGQVRNPAFSVLAPSLIAAYQSGQVDAEKDVTTTMEDVGGRSATKLTFPLTITQQVPVIQQGQQGSQQGSQQGQSQPETRTVTINQEYSLWIDPTSGMPIQETQRGTDSGNEVSFRTATFENATLVDRSSLPADTLSLQSVQNMVASVDQVLDRARQIGFTVYWLGRELPRGFTDARGQRQSGLVLHDIQVTNVPDAPKQVVMVYGSRDDAPRPYVVIRQMPRSQFEELLRQSGLPPISQVPGVQQQPVQVPGGAQGVLYQIQPPSGSGSGGPARGGPGANPPSGQTQSLPPYVTVQITSGDSITLIETPPVPTDDGRQGNPFLDPVQIAALAGALAVLNQ
ncbi:MAG TPA: hypothetical protein VFE37_23440 [Chloroflexota bacterium]|nr:hypothetical protein [Chloroflexota bacterium]